MLVDQTEKQKSSRLISLSGGLTAVTKARLNIKLTRNLDEPPLYEESQLEDIKSKWHDRSSFLPTLSSPPRMAEDIDNVLKELRIISLSKYSSIVPAPNKSQKPNLKLVRETRMRQTGWLST